MTELATNSGLTAEWNNFMEKKKYESNNYIWEILRDLVPFDKFKKREKHPWRSATFSNFTKGNTLAWVFFTFFK